MDGNSALILARAYLVGAEARLNELSGRLKGAPPSDASSNERTLRNADEWYAKHPKPTVPAPGAMYDVTACDIGGNDPRDFGMTDKEYIRLQEQKWRDIMVFSRRRIHK